MPQSLRSYLALLKAELPEVFLQVDKEVSSRHQIATILEKVRKEKKSAAVYFPSVEGKEFSVVGNVISDRKRVCLALGLSSESEDYGVTLRDRLDRFLPPIQVQSGPVQEVKQIDDELDLSKLPILTHAESDTLPSLLLGVAIARNPQSGAVAVSLPQVVMLDDRRMGIIASEDCQLSACIQASTEKGEVLEVALVIGMHPSFYLCAASEMDGVDSLGRIGSMMGESLPVIRTITSDLPVPAHAEIVIEGVLCSEKNQTLTTPASPIGYEGTEKSIPVLEVKAITHRKDAIFQAGGIFGERRFLPTPIREAEALRALKLAVPAVVDVRIPAITCGYHAYVQVDQKKMGEGKKALLAALGSIPEVKTVFAVDKDILLEVDREVMWVLATRVVADRDLFMVPGVVGDPEDPTSYEITRRGRGGMVTRLGIDATTPIGLPYQIPEPTKIPGTENIKLDEYLEEWSDDLD